MSLYVFTSLQPLTLVPLCAIHPTDQVTHLCCVPRHAGSAILTIAAPVGLAGHRDPACIHSERPCRRRRLAILLRLLRLLQALLVPTLGTRLTVMLATLALVALVHVVEALVVEVDAIIPGASIQVLACITRQRMEIT